MEVTCFKKNFKVLLTYRNFKAIEKGKNIFFIENF